MIEKLWYGKNRWYWLLMPLSLLYGFIVFIRRTLYQIGLFKSWKAPIPIIVVGNLSVGGNGKTPLVVALIESLKKQGLRVGVVSRGYGGQSAHYPLILNNKSTALQAGDEPILIYQRTAVPVAISPHRSDAVKALLAETKLDLILTDDGLQHYALARDIEIVVIDGKRQFGNGWWLPAGPMRERKNRLRTVDMIIINGDSPSGISVDFIDKTYRMQLEPKYAINLLTQEKQSLSDLKQICAIAGISNPNRFFTMLDKLNADIIKTVSFADHQQFSRHLLDNLVTPQQILLMTEKDAVKCQPFAKANWWYLPIDATLPTEAIEQLYSLYQQHVIDEIKQ